MPSAGVNDSEGAIKLRRTYPQNFRSIRVTYGANTLRYGALPCLTADALKRTLKTEHFL